MTPRVTPQTWQVIQEFLRDPTGRYGLELSKATGLPTGTVYPILDRLVEGGLLEERRETTNVADKKRPPRRLFEINAAGRVWAAQAEIVVRERYGMIPAFVMPGVT